MFAISIPRSSGQAAASAVVAVELKVVELFMEELGEFCDVLIA